MAAAEPAGQRQLTRRISWGGLLAALILLLLMARHWAPTADLAFLTLASLAVAIAVLELDLQTAGLVYLAAALLSLAYPGLAAALPFLVLFGPYPLLRALIDGHFRRLPATLLKLLAGNLLAGLAAALFLRPDLNRLADRYGVLVWVVLPVILQAALLVYDYALSLLIQLYMTRLHRR